MSRKVRRRDRINTRPEHYQLSLGSSNAQAELCISSGERFVVSSSTMGPSFIAHRREASCRLSKNSFDSSILRPTGVSLPDSSERLLILALATACSAVSRRVKSGTHRYDRNDFTKRQASLSSIADSPIISETGLVT